MNDCDCSKEHEFSALERKISDLEYDLSRVRSDLENQISNLRHDLRDKAERDHEH